MQWTMILVIFRIGRWVLGIGFVRRAEVVQLIVNAKNGSCQQQELSDDGAIPGGNLMLFADCQRDEGKDYCCEE